MAAGQQWLFTPSKPLVERLGKKFFRKVPAQPGVYSMRNAREEVVYVGKAKNLRQRLRSYRVANPERMPRRHLRLVREVARIDFDLCPNESAAQAHEARLLRRLKPKFNRAGVWPGKARFLTWLFVDRVLNISIAEVPRVGWERFGPLGGSAPRLHGSLVRLLWLALNPQAGFSRLPHGWAQNRFALPVAIVCGAREAEIRLALDSLFWGQPAKCAEWLQTSIGDCLPTFDKAAILTDLEEVESFATNHRNGRSRDDSQLALL